MMLPGTDRPTLRLSDRTRIRIGLGMAAFSVASALVGVGIYLWLGLGARMIGDWVLQNAFIAVLAGILSAIVMRRQPRNGAVWALSWIAVVSALMPLTIGLLQYDLASLGIAPELSALVPAELPLSTALLFQVAGTVWIPHNYVWILALLVFPNGRLPSPRWAWVGRVTVIAMVYGTAVGAWATRPTISTPAMTQDPTRQFDATTQALYVTSMAILAVLTALATAALIVRYRSSAGPVRQQIRWIAWVVVVLTVEFLILFPLQWTEIGLDPYQYTSMFTIGLFFVAYVVAITRYRLYEIDRILSRTVSYGIVTAILAGVYVGAVISAQAIFGGEQHSATIVAGSTLLVAGLFQPLRRRAQTIIDRRFNRRVHDAGKAIEAFGERLRDQVELERLVDDLRATVSGIVQPAGVGVWLPPPGRGPSPSPLVPAHQTSPASAHQTSPASAHQTSPASAHQMARG